MTVDGLASLDGGINTNDDFTVDTDGNIVNVAITSSGLASLDGGIDVATAKFAVSTAGIVTTVEDIRITADNKQLEIGAGTDFTIGHDGTNTTITNATGILAINGAAASAIRVNEAGANVDFVVEGDTNTGLLTIDASQDNVGIGGAPNANAVLHVSSTGAMIIPVGTTAQRPTGVTGMLRYSSTAGGLEFYDNDSWESVSSEFTVATTEQFSGNGSTTEFTLQATAGGEAYSAAGILVFINGVAQDINAYALSGAGNVTMTLDEAPLSGDTIEVRKFTTSTTVTAIADTDGNTQIQVEEGSNDNTIRFDTDGTERVTITSAGLNIISGVMTGTATEARYADLAEMYAADADISAGTVVCFAGEGKVAECDVADCRSVAGIVSTDPAHLMNSTQEGVALALAGRVPCKVTGAVAAGDLMVSAGNGMAMANNDAAMGTVIGKAIEASEGGESVIEVLALMM